MLDQLRQDLDTLTQILEARQAVSIETLSDDASRLWSMYLAILREAVATLRVLIKLLDR